MLLCGPLTAVRAAEPVSDAVLQAQNRRIAMIERVTPGVVAVFDAKQRGGGSGVLIDPDGYGVTNYHVVAKLLDTRRGLGGISDGKLYDLEVLGIDPTGDVAMFRLLGRDRFPFVKWGNAETVHVGDTAVAMGNPFTLSEDYTPTVTLGIVTGVHRYQWGVKGNLVYSDCLQIDTPINPGNSGGPLFNASGEVIGINGRISLNVRGRYNVGFGYSITSNQIQRFVPALRAGLLARHGTLQAIVEQRQDGQVAFSELLPGGPAERAGARVGDRLVAVDGVAISTANQFASVLGTYPGRWTVVMELERAGRRWETVARLEPLGVNLPRKFVPDREANERQIRRVLRAFQEMALGEKNRTLPSHRQWSLRREFLENGTKSGKETGKAKEQYSVSVGEKGTVLMEEIAESETTGRIIEFDDQRATLRMKAGGEALQPTIDVRITLGAMYLLYHRFLTSPAGLDLSKAEDIGGDVAIPRRWEKTARGRAEKKKEKANAKEAKSLVASRRFVEVIRWPVAQSGVAEIAFDSESHEIVRMVVRDKPSGVRVTMYPGDYRNVGSLRLPCSLEVYGPGYAYRDVLGDYKLRP